MIDFDLKYNSLKTPEFLKFEPTNIEYSFEEEVPVYDFQKKMDKFYSLLSSIKQPEDKKESSVEFGVDNSDFKELNTEQLKQSNISNYNYNDKISSKLDFINVFKPLIQQELTNQGINLNYTNQLLAHLAHESAFGKRIPKNSNNYAGFKGKGVSTLTKEYVNGRYKPMVQSFMKFPDKQSFVKYYVDRMKNRFDAFNGGDMVTNIKRKGYFTARLNDYKKAFNNVLKDIEHVSK